MRHFTTRAILAAAAIVTVAQPTFASVPRPGTVAAVSSRLTRQACRDDLRSAVCGRHQEQLLDAVLDDARSNKNSATSKQVARRQLDALIDSIG